MVFSSAAFLSAFLPLTLGVCFALRRWVKAQNAALLVLSLLFYAWGEWRHVPLLLLSALMNAWLGRLAAANKGKKWPVAAAAALNLGLLAYFKYAGFFAGALGSGWTGPALPLGISFFTFQGLSYVIDMHRGREEMGTGMEACLYVALFPQLVAGPIVRWGQVRRAMRERSITLEGVGEGFCRFIPGLAKKVLLADTLGKIADAAFSCPDGNRSALFALLGGVAFCLQLYLDFSGYSDMAIGLGRMLGFDFPENFDHPYRSLSITEFWRRWHITLSAWFRDYVYIPLGGSRKGRGRTLLNLGLVFLLTGLWHGAGWTFILWGLWNGLWAVLERTEIVRPGNWKKPFAWAYAMLIALLGFIVFRAPTPAAAWEYLVSLFTHWRINEAAAHACLLSLTPAALIALAAAVPVSAGVKAPLPPWGRYALCFALLLLCCLFIVSSGYHPFLYFRF